MEVGAWDILCLAVVVESVVETEAFPSWLPSSVTATRYWILVLVQKETETTKEGTVSLAWRAACNERILQTIKQARCQVERKRTVIEEEGLQSVLLIARCAAHLARVSLMIFKSGRCS